MFTNIRKVTNQQPFTPKGGVAFANNEPDHAGEGWACVPGFSAAIGRYLPVPRTSKHEQGLWIYTMRGCCQVIDDDWKIKGKWNGETEETFLKEGAGGNIEVKIDPQGNISMSKA